jgi:hypothetical protein
VSTDVDHAIAQLDRVVRRKRIGQVTASVLMVVIGGVLFAVTGVVALRVLGIAFGVLGVATFLAIRHSELARAHSVRRLLRGDPDGIVWIWSAQRLPNHPDQHWVVFHCRDGRVYSAIAPAPDAVAWIGALRRICPHTLFTEGMPSREMREAWRAKPAIAPSVRQSV